MALSNKVQALMKMVKERPGGILTIYLDTDRSKPQHQNGEWRIRLKNGLKKLEEYLAAQQALEEKTQFSKLAERVQKKVLTMQRELQKGLIVFASHDLELWEMNSVQVPVTNQFFWEESAEISQLQEIQKKYPRCGIILPQSDSVRIIDLDLGQIVEEFHYDWTLETEELQSEQSEKRKDMHVKRQFKKIVPRLQQEVKNRAWEKIYLVGETSYTEAFHDDLKHISELHVSSKNLSNISTHDLLVKVI